MINSTFKPKAAAKPRTRKCSICKIAFVKRSMSHVVCSPLCAIESNRQKAIKADRKDTAALKLAIKPRAKWLAEAQSDFNAFVRRRDERDACISCGNTREKSKYNAGHYLSVGAQPSLRFNEDNCHKQCEHCNTHLSGNIAAYRPKLLAKIGADRLDALEGPHSPAKYTIDDLIAIKATYKLKLKELREVN